MIIISQVFDLWDFFITFVELILFKTFMSELVVEILCSALGTVRKHDESKGEISFDCPTCSEEKGQYDGDGKGNLEINYHTGIFQCWSCSQTNGTKGTVRKLFKLFGNKDHQKRYELLIPDDNYVDKKEKEKINQLDKTFIPLVGGNGREYEKAINYLYGRNISDEMIKKYDFHYVIEGLYRGKVVVPSLSTDGTYNYFVSRTYCNQKPKYINPEADKNIIIFNEGRISWDATIYLVEGVFDHIVVPNSIPLLGKMVSEHLYEQLQMNCKANIVICLDDDAWGDTIKLFKKLNCGKLYNRVKVIKVPNGYDLSDIYNKFGKSGIIKLLKTSIKLKESTL
jgi:DNA primase